MVQIFVHVTVKPSLQYHTDANVDADSDAGVEMNLILASASVSTSKDATASRRCL